MEKIIKIPIIQLADTLRNSYQGFAFMTVDCIRTMSRYNYNFHGEQDVRSFSRINLVNGNNITVDLPIDGLVRLFKCNLLSINAETFSPIKNITSINNYARNEWRIDTLKDGWNFRTDNIHIFNGDTIVRYNPDDLISLWEKEITNKPIIKNLKVASGGNV